MHDVKLASELKKDEDKFFNHTWTPRTIMQRNKNVGRLRNLLL